MNGKYCLSHSLEIPFTDIFSDLVTCDKVLSIIVEVLILQLDPGY